MFLAEINWTNKSFGNVRFNGRHKHCQAFNFLRYFCFKSLQSIRSRLLLAGERHELLGLPEVHAEINDSLYDNFHDSCDSCDCLPKIKTEFDDSLYHSFYVNCDSLYYRLYDSFYHSCDSLYDSCDSLP